MIYQCSFVNLMVVMFNFNGTANNPFLLFNVYAIIFSVNYFV